MEQQTKQLDTAMLHSSEEWWDGLSFEAEMVWFSFVFGLVGLCGLGGICVWFGCWTLFYFVFLFGAG